MQELFRQFMEDESGQGLVEYALILVIMAIGVAIALTALRDQVGDSLGEVEDELGTYPAAS